MQEINKEASELGKVYLVGAGPGDPELITLKAINKIREADVILYDALVHPELLEYVGENAQAFCVGKRGGRPSRSQADINQKLLDYARQSHTVLRLKGGDPFVFGRGHDEEKFLREHGVRTETVPGISSATGLCATSGIPLTARGVNQSFWVLTGTTRYGDLTDDMKLAAESSATVVVLMGVRKIPQLAELYSRLGRSGTPAAVIQNGSLANEKMVMGRIEELPWLAEKEGLKSPAVIIIGDTVAEHPEYVRERLISEHLSDLQTVEEAFGQDAHPRKIPERDARVS